MKSNLFIIIMIVTAFSCKSVEQQPVKLSMEYDPCDYLRVDKLAPLVDILVTDIIAQSGENGPTKKVCTHYLNKRPTPEPLVHVTIEYSSDKTSGNFGKIIEGMLVNGLPSSSGTLKYKKLSDKRFNAIYTEDEALFNQAYVEVGNQYLIVIEYDKKLNKNGDPKELMSKLISSVLYDEKMY